MALEKLSRLDDWTVANDRQDIRGQDLYERNGGPLGTVDDFVVDTESRLVQTIILKDGQRFDADDIDIGADGIYLNAQAQADRSHAGPADHSRVKVYGDPDDDHDRPSRAP